MALSVEAAILFLLVNFSMNSRPERTTHHDSEHFYKQLFNASINASYTPLWRIKDGPKGERGGAIIRIKTLQQMNVTHIRKLLADEVAFMVHHKSTDREQMRLIEDLMSRYCQHNLNPPSI